MLKIWAFKSVRIQVYIVKKRFTFEHGKVKFSFTHTDRQTHSLLPFAPTIEFFFNWGIVVN